MINVELKVSVKDFKGIIFHLKKIGAGSKGKFSQVDTYYKSKNGRLKIREIDHKFYQLITYYRKDQAESKISDYTIEDLNKKELKQYKWRLSRTNGKSVKVSKKRELWIYNNTRIHLDKIQGLGKFIELETVVKNPDDLQQLEKEHQEVINLLNLSSFTRVSKSYSDLILEKKNQRKELASHLIQHPKTFPI
ncbi:MAG: class IV adenylate cyclase [Patescibacteria group bacterium]|jgi:predicted adenylyl cyclase CyaB